MSKSISLGESLTKHGCFEDIWSLEEAVFSLSISQGIGKTIPSSPSIVFRIVSQSSFSWNN